VTPAPGGREIAEDGDACSGEVALRKPGLCCGAEPADCCGEGHLANLTHLLARSDRELAEEAAAGGIARGRELQDQGNRARRKGNGAWLGVRNNRITKPENAGKGSWEG